MSTLNKLNHTPQAHARVCKDNKKELQEKRMPIKFLVKKIDFQICRRRLVGQIKTNFTGLIHHTSNILIRHEIIKYWP